MFEEDHCDFPKTRPFDSKVVNMYVSIAKSIAWSNGLLLGKSRMIL